MKKIERFQLATSVVCSIAGIGLVAASFMISPLRLGHVKAATTCPYAPSVTDAVGANTYKSNWAVDEWLAYDSGPGFGGKNINILGPSGWEVSGSVTDSTGTASGYSEKWTLSQVVNNSKVSGQPNGAQYGNLISRSAGYPVNGGNTTFGSVINNLVVVGTDHQYAAANLNKSDNYDGSFDSSANSNFIPVGSYGMMADGGTDPKRSRTYEPTEWTVSGCYGL